MAISFTPGQTVAPPDWESLFAQHGGSKSSVRVERKPLTKEERNKIEDEGGDPDAPEQNPTYRYYAEDGSYVEAKTAPNGQDYLIVDYKPSAKFQESQKPSANSNKPTTRHIEGTPIPGRPGEYDNTQPIAVNRDANGNQVGPAEALTEPERLRWEREKNGGKTDAELREPPKPRQSRPNPADPTRMQEFNPDTGKWEDAGVNAAGVQAAADRNKPGAPTLKPDGKGGTIAVQTMPDGTIKTTPLPGVPSDKPNPERVTVGGVVYERDPQTGRYAPAPGLPSEGAATVGGPKMPQIIHNQAAQLATQYHESLWNDPSLTPAQREKRFQEFIQAANLAVQQAATDASERQSARNTAYNIASGKADYLRNGMKQALDFAGSLKGTDLGGKIFGAMLNLNLAVLQASGIDDVMKQYGPFPTITPADMRSSAAIDAKRAQIDQSITQSHGTPPFVQPDQPSVSAAAAAAPAPATTASPKPAAAAPPPAAPPTLAPPVTSPVIEPPSKDHIPSLASPTPAPSASTAGPSLGQGQDASDYPAGVVPPGYPDMSVQPPMDQAPSTPDGSYERVGPYEPAPYNDDPSQGPVSMMPHDFAALRPFGQPMPTPGGSPASLILDPAQMAATAARPPLSVPGFSPERYGHTRDNPLVSPGGDRWNRAIGDLAAAIPGGQAATETPTALRLAQIAATPSWLMSEDDYNFAKQNGQEGLFWKRPGEAA